jgi:AraC-like DNA-binding protein
LTSLDVVSTADVPVADRLAVWGDFVRRHIGPLKADTFGDRAFAGRLELGRVGAMPLARILASRHRVLRTPSLIRKDERSYVKLVAQVGGAACFEQNGRKVVLAPGEWSLYDTTKPYTVSNPEPINEIIMLLPRDRLVRLGLNLDELVVRRFAGRSGVGRLTYDLLVSAFDRMQREPDAQSENELGDTIAHLVQLAVLEREGTTSEASQREITRDRVKSFIASNLNDPMLSLNRIAGAIGCSKRYLHKLFDEESEALNAFIWRSRLERIRQDLANPALAQSSITEIAFGRGFNSSTHFSRSFREIYGIAPSVYRLLMQGSGASWQRVAERQLRTPPLGFSAAE